ncbi:probable N-acetylgalactosaminyltransferase 9 isoform X2 [Watersipora subatra]|uniref:probable N-acetylgalactosaminyltransferase 9 isoform X2 n=1 Tax=Watersipora subatra TaxID=2589382 RepID=UPI00355C3030
MIPKWLRRKGWTNTHLAGCCLLILTVYRVWYTSLMEINNDDQGMKPHENSQHHSEGKTKDAYRYKRYELRNQVNVGSPGERGGAVTLTGKDKALADSLFKKEAFNIIASNRIALNRTLSDIRDPACKKLTYPKDLPTASVVIIFHNEAWSALMRTVHSVVNRSPPEHLHEVVLLDDFSDREELGCKEECERVKEYVKSEWPDGVVKYVRTKARSGLIRARIAGAEAATGDVLIFLDSHCEAGEGWIEPLLARIKEKRSAILCPMIDAIDDKTLFYSLNGGEAVGGFTWSLHFTWHQTFDREMKRRESKADYIRSPTMAGGLFAADRKYFWEIGGYDPGMDVWGGENLEISFRVWMCGGSLEFIPCSRVGHIFRSSHPYTFPGNKDTHGINSKRLAEVWMDEYKRLFYMHRHDLASVDAGDITERVELREHLKCKSFKWYLENVYPEKFIPDENVIGHGMLRNPSTNLCLDTLGKDEKTTFEVSVYPCQGGKSASEVFSMSHDGALRREEGCLSSAGGPGATVRLEPCPVGQNMPSSMLWDYDKSEKRVKHRSSGSCLDADKLSASKTVKLQKCEDKDTQKWELEFML